MAQLEEPDGDHRLLTIAITSWNTLVVGSGLAGTISPNRWSAVDLGVAAIPARLSEVQR